MIYGVQTKNLKVIPDERGRLMEIVRADDEIFQMFGQVYITTCYPGVVKAWHYHKIQTDLVCAIQGMIKLVLYDPTKKEFNEFFIGEHRLWVVSIPKDIYHGWKCTSQNEAIILNMPTEPYNYNEPDEYRLPAHGKEIPYDWSRQDG